MNNYIYTIFLTFLLSFNNFNHDDWLSVIKPQNILSITEDSFELHFLSENGIFSYNFLEDIIYYNESFSYKLPKKGIMLHYNKSNDFYYLFTNKRIFFKSSVAYNWNTRQLLDFDIINFSEIDKIGFSGNNLILESNNDLVVINSFTMNVIDDYEILDIKWIYNSESNKLEELSNYYSLENFILSSDYLKDSSNDVHFVNTYHYDAGGNLWIGMNSGALFKVKKHSNEILRVDIGPRLNEVSGVYYDNLDTWYYYDKYFKRTGNFNKPNSGYFLSIYKEKEDKWSHITNNHNLFTQNAIINNLTRINNYLVFSTIDGILFYDTINEKWYHEYDFSSKNNRSIWKIIEHKNKLFIATSNGVVISNFFNIDDEPELVFDKILLNYNEIYDLELFNDELYICSFKGVYKYNFNNDSLIQITKDLYYDIELSDQYMLALNDNLWSINHTDKRLISSNIDFFKFLKPNLIAASSDREIRMISLNSNKEWYINLSKNIDSIYSLDCDDEWLWVTNSKGLTFFNWNNYE